MDIATILGIVGGFGVLIGAVFLEGSHLSQFMNLLATMVVLGGATTAVLIRYPLHAYIGALTLGLKQAFIYRHTSPRHLIDELKNLADLVRAQGPLGLESVEIANPFLAKGAQMIADGYSTEMIRQSLEKERDLEHERLEEGSKIFKALGDAAPGMGMVGTIIGLISMFSHMDDPKKIGPGMAIALLTTLYGAVFANLVFLPIGDKLANRAQEHETNSSMIIDAIVMIRENTSPTMVFEQLLAYLPLHHREQPEMKEAA